MKMLKIKNYFGFFVSVTIGYVLFLLAWEPGNIYGMGDVVSALVHSMSNGRFSFNGVLFPILAALPMATQYVREWKSGYLKLVFSKQKRNTYIVKLLFRNAFIGGGALALPVILFIFQLYIYYKDWYNPEGEINHVHFLKEIAAQNGGLYVLVVIFIVFCCGGTFATLSLGISAWTRNSFLTIMLPFALCIIVAMTTPDFGWDLLLLYSPNIYTETSIISIIIMEFFLLVCGIVLFVVGVYRNEE